MNTKGNQRYQETKNRIKGALLILIRNGNSDVSVRMICEQAQIHRTTFYGHYEDMNALLNEMVAELYVQIIDYLIPDHKELDPEGFEKIFELAQREKEFFLYYFCKVRQDLRKNLPVPELLLKHHVMLEERMGLKNQEELMYQQGFFSAGANAMLMSWLQNGCKESPKEMGELMKKNYVKFFNG